MYSGGGATAVRAREVWTWYTRAAAGHARDLSLTALAPAAFLYAALAISAGLTVVLAAGQIRALQRRN